MHTTLVIVGGGFCGTVLAANLLRRPPSDATDIVLIERGLRHGPRHGVCRARVSLSFQCAGGAAVGGFAGPLAISALCAAPGPDADGEDFLPRALYGEYLQDLLLQAERAAPAGTAPAARVRRGAARHRAERRQTASRRGVRGPRADRGGSRRFWRWAIRRRRLAAVGRRDQRSRGDIGMIHGKLPENTLGAGTRC